jgi:hypothetical protein
MPEARPIDYFEIVTADIWKPSVRNLSYQGMRLEGEI